MVVMLVRCSRGQRHEAACRREVDRSLLLLVPAADDDGAGAAAALRADLLGAGPAAVPQVLEEIEAELRRALLDSHGSPVEMKLQIGHRVIFSGWSLPSPFFVPNQGEVGRIQ